MSNEIMVSISCITYNHENYIADAIEGFLMQQTDFKYEILIHDDASTDRTADIIREYEKKYPDIIKPIYQTENQYSKGINVGQFNRNRALGKYMALCEGDDYWIHSLKLQKQVDFLEAHPFCSMCFHAAKVIDVINDKEAGFVRPFKKSCILNDKKLLYGGGSVAATASLVFLRSAVEYLPKFYFNSPVGDIPLLLILANKGRIGYINEVMSVRNLWVPGSYMTKYRKEKTNEEKIDHIGKMVNVLDDFNTYSNYKWNKDILKINTMYKLQVLELQSANDINKSKELKILIKDLSLIDKLKVIGNRLIPKQYKMIKNILKKGESISR